jgi:dTMP kinase
LGFFITFEGPEGSGKTTQLALLATHLRAQGFDVLTTREPGGTDIGDRVRAILLDPQHTEMAPETEFLLFSAARAQHVAEVIRPHLARGGVVLCDRYADSSLAYQGYGHRRELAVLRAITAYATGELVPELSIYFDVPARLGLQRKMGTDGDGWNRMEQKEIDFHERVRAGYLEMLEQEPERWTLVDAVTDVDQVHAAVLEAVRARGLIDRDRTMGEEHETGDEHRP